MPELPSPRRLARLAVLCCALGGALSGQSGAAPPEEPQPTLAELRVQGAARSRYAAGQIPAAEEVAAAGPDLEGFRRDVEPVLRRTCHRCHGPEEDEGGLRLDELDPDLFAGDDVDWWLDVLAVLTNGEMPPADGPELADADRRRAVEWLATESQRASQARRATREHTSFRRLTRYEYDHALQDLLGLPYDFASGLPPDPASGDGFRNSSETLHLSAAQLRTYLDAGRRALQLATFTGERPAPLYWSVSMRAAAAREWAAQDQQLGKLREQHADDPAQAEAEVAKQLERFQQPPGGTWFEDPDTGRKARQSWDYNGARYAWTPSELAPDWPPVAEHVAVVSPDSSLIVELGDRVAERGALRVRFRAARAEVDGPAPRLRLIFGWQASNDSRALMRVSEADVVVDAPPGAPAIYGFEVPLSQIYPRNSVRGVNRLGDLPSPSEFVRIAHAGRGGGPVRIDHVEVTAPVHEQWPPASHLRVFPPRAAEESERAYARRVLIGFVERAWRRAPTEAEIERKLGLFDAVRPACDAVEPALVEVLAAALASPNFLYVVEAHGGGDGRTPLSDDELATRLALFLWCSIPDAELRALARERRLAEPERLAGQVGRMLADPRSRRFSRQFVHQWLNLELLEFLQVDGGVHPGFDDALKASMLEEPIAFFDGMLRGDRSVLDLLHSDYAVVDERLAAHYGLAGVVGDAFRPVPLDAGARRGGLLTQAGLLAMNSDGVDSHPLKRGVWLLERLLNDPPPPPPAAVPQIDLADPEIAKLTLKQRIERHRDHPACMSCHARIDPWGFAFENFDAVGLWRAEVGGQPVDAAGVLFNGQRIDGIDGLKRYLLGDRQDQFVRALVHKLAAFALGRPLTFEDRADLDRITAVTRRRGDGLATLVTAIVQSDLFRSK
jgi:mono/diheme cytochrome c family protein